MQKLLDPDTAAGVSVSTIHALPAQKHGGHFFTSLFSFGKFLQSLQNIYQNQLLFFALEQSPTGRFALHICMIMQTTRRLSFKEMPKQITSVQYFAAAIAVDDRKFESGRTMKSQAFMRVLANLLIHSFWG